MKLNRSRIFMISGAAGPADRSTGVDTERLQSRLEGAPQRIDAARATDVEQLELFRPQFLGDERRKF
jgi:hypothetical protein